MIQNLVPVSEHYAAQNGMAPFFTVKQLNENGDDASLTISPNNILNLENDRSQPDMIQSIISGIYDALTIDNCYVTAEVLRKVFDFEHVLSEEKTFTHFAKETCGNDPDKAGILMMKMACEQVLSVEKDDLLEYFVKSKLGILLLRDMINIKFAKGMSSRKKKTSLSKSVIKSIERQYLESPLSSCYVKKVEVETIDHKNKAKYIRTRPKFHFQMNTLFKNATADLPTKEHFDSINRKDWNNSMYVFGEIIACMLGHTGDYCSSDAEFQKKKQVIEQKWNDQANYAMSTGKTYTRPKWYDTYAGTREISTAKYKLILEEVDSHMSIFSTLCAMKRNIVTLLYMLKVFILATTNGKECNMTEELKLMAQKFPRYFINAESLCTTYKTPVKIPKASRSPYFKIEELMFYNSPLGAKHARNAKFFHIGLSKDMKEKIISTEEKELKKYKNLDVLNVYSKLSLTESERLALGNDTEEKHSLALLPLSLGSYQNCHEVCNNVKFTCGIQSKVGYQDTPTWIAKATLLYEKFNQDVERTLLSGKRIREEDAKADAKEMVYLLMKNGHTMEEACKMVSLSSDEMVDDENEPETKRRVKEECFLQK
jgi:hypothetical protein